MNNKEKLYLAKFAGQQPGAAAGFWAGKDTGAEKGVGAAAGVTAGLGATPIPVMDAKNLRRSNKALARFKGITSGLGAGPGQRFRMKPDGSLSGPGGYGSIDRHTKKLEGINKNLDRKVPGYMRTEHTGIPKRPLTAGPDSGYLSTADVLSGK